MFVKAVATVTVLVANVVICICVMILYQLVWAGSESLASEDTKYLVTVSCTFLLCLLVLITATLDNISWWSNSFPDAFMSQKGLKDLLNR